MQSPTDDSARPGRQAQAPQDTAARPTPTNIVGLSPMFTDPLWRIPVRLRPVEVALLCTAPLRRLYFVAHRGASSLSTVQSYSRLEHSLGVLALVAHFRPDDAPLRVAALVHDIGHLPLSHTFEGIHGLDHHAIGLRLLRADPVRPVLASHGVCGDGGSPPRSPENRRRRSTTAPVCCTSTISTRTCAAGGPPGGSRPIPP